MAAYITPRATMGFCGGLIILNEVGGIGSNLMGEPLTIESANSILVGNKATHNEILEIKSS